MITNLTAEQMSPSAFLLRWASTLGDDATFRVYRDGELIAMTALNEWLVTVEEGEAPVFEVLDDDTPAPSPAFPGYLLISWYSVAGWSNEVTVDARLSRISVESSSGPSGADGWRRTSASLIVTHPFALNAPDFVGGRPKPTSGQSPPTVSAPEVPVAWKRSDSDVRFWK